MARRDRQDRDQVGAPPAGGDQGQGGRAWGGPPAADAAIERTRTATLFAAAVAGLVLAMLMLVFVLQNDESQRFEFLWFDFELPTGVAILLAAIVGGLVVASLGLGRVVQLRLAARRHRRADHGG
ncbi:MAG TPA: lipopolysaccharide assembly protein LapA domain-containing protein [Acidimicrobiales bacterium]|nr:lipopolysaccharide assembly protein LapA domain-containing protein [Acidimicrobiales bacterium]